jgi:hypothetical protein
MSIHLYPISKLTLIPILLSLYFTVDAQQWKPVSNTEKFNFRIDTATYVSNVISVDSFALQGADTVFFLNRIVTPSSNPYRWLYDQPQFLERRMIRKQDGIYLFTDPGSFRLNTLAGLNASWTFDTVANLTAQVTSKIYEQVLTQWDSVKTITLSNSEIIRISKDHGIIQFPLQGTSHYYLLEGIAGRNLGILVPGFRDIFNFHTGDVFQYRNEYLQYGAYQGNVSLVKQTIGSRDSSSSGYSYGLTISGMRWNKDPIVGYEWDTTHFYNNTTEVFTDSTFHFSNINPSGLVHNPPLDYIPMNSAAIMHIFPDTGQTVSRQMGQDVFDGPDKLFSFGTGDTLVPDYANEYFDKYTVGLGRVAYVFAPFETYYEEKLIGYVKNGDTTGIVYSDDFLLEKVPEKEAGKFNIFPNPVTDNLFIEGTSFSRNTILSLMNAEGQELIQKQIMNQKTQVDLGFLPAGVYFLRIKNEKTVQIIKIIKE